MIVKGSKKEKFFINDLIKAIKFIDTNNLTDAESLENSITNVIERIWDKNSKIVNITKYLKSWWNSNCSMNLKKYKLTRRLKDMK